MHELEGDPRPGRRRRASRGEQTEIEDDWRGQDGPERGGRDLERVDRENRDSEHERKGRLSDEAIGGREDDDRDRREGGRVHGPAIRDTGLTDAAVTQTCRVPRRSSPPRGHPPTTFTFFRMGLNSRTPPRWLPAPSPPQRFKRPPT